MNFISTSADLGKNVQVGYFSVISEGVILGDNVVVGNCCTLEAGVNIAANTIIGNNTTIHADTTIGSDCFVGNSCTIGRKPRPAATSTVKVQADLPALELGIGVTVGSGAVLYRGTKIGNNVMLGDRAGIRERCVVGNNVIVGTSVVVENDTTIGEFTKIQSGSYITAYMTIEDKVFIAPMVTTTNDNFMGRTEKRFKYIKGPTIKRGARVGGASILLPGITVAEESFIAAGALVTKDTAPAYVVKGLPAAKVREVSSDELLND